MELVYQNVNHAFSNLVKLFDNPHSGWVETDSRNGPVRTIEEPVRVTYLQPRQRVLFNPARDANPFFHLFESLWMLAGRDDVAPLKYYVSTIDDYSDNGKTLHGAYGHRWRKYFSQDQLKIIADQLKTDPNSRRCVLQMWNGPSDLDVETKDKPCNLSACFKIQKDKFGDLAYGPEHPKVKSGKVSRGEQIGRSFLDMTVFNRSNDLIWGMLGANVVHFSILQEYLAARIGVGVGKYHQISNNLHVYTDKWKPNKWLACHDQDYQHTYQNKRLAQLVLNPHNFDIECKQITDSIDGCFTEPFLRDTAQPMFAAFRKHKHRRYIGDQGALELIERVHAADWRIVGRDWLLRRKAKWEKKR
jgi:thymidylate synthase